MKETCFVLPIAAGREEEWRRLLQELAGSRSGDLERARRRLGIGAVRVWLRRDQRGVSAVVLMEVDDPAQAVAALAGSQETFDGWLKRRIEECHGVDVTRARPNRALELVFRLGPEAPGAGRPGRALEDPGVRDPIAERVRLDLAEGRRP